MRERVQLHYPSAGTKKTLQTYKSSQKQHQKMGGGGKGKGGGGGGLSYTHQVPKFLQGMLQAKKKPPVKLAMPDIDDDEGDDLPTVLYDNQEAFEVRDFEAWQAQELAKRKAAEHRREERWPAMLINIVTLDRRCV